jgi:hypothetical protein
MKVAAVTLLAYPSHICDSLVTAAAYFPTRRLHGEQNDNRLFGVDCSRMLLIVVLHNTLISSLKR